MSWKPTVAELPAVLGAVAEELGDAGWDVSRPTAFGDFEICRTFPGGWRATGWLSSSVGVRDEAPYVGVSVRIEGAHPCST